MYFVYLVFSGINRRRCNSTTVQIVLFLQACCCPHVSTKRRQIALVLAGHFCRAFYPLIKVWSSCKASQIDIGKCSEPGKSSPRWLALSFVSYELKAISEQLQQDSVTWHNIMSIMMSQVWLDVQLGASPVGCSSLPRSESIKSHPRKEQGVNQRPHVWSDGPVKVWSVPHGFIWVTQGLLDLLHLKKK